ncbi:MAG TPA: tetratricopeptide repeat protein [Bryobacteraceae bacterium]
MASLAPQLAVCFCCLTALMAAPQSAPAPSFDDIVRRAGDAVDRNPEESVKLYQQALAMRPAYVDGWLYLGAGLYQLHRYAEAGDAFQKGIHLAPQNGTGWGFLGLCRYELNEPAEALKAILEGEQLELGGNQMFGAAVRTRGAQILLASGSYEDALKQLTPLSIAAISPPQAVEMAGLAALRMQAPLATLTPEQLAMVKLAGQAEWAAMAHQVKEADTSFHDLIAKYPNERGVHFAYGTFLREDDPKASEAEFERELSIDSKNAQAFVELARLRITAGGTPDSAIAPARGALQLDPHNALAHAVLGHALLEKGEAANAIAELEEATKLAPNELATRTDLAAAYHHAGRLADALKEEAYVTRLRERQEFGTHSFLARRLPVSGGAAAK